MHPLISIIIPVLYEGSFINQRIESLQRQFSADSFEIIVADGDPEKSTVKHILCPSIKTVTAPRGRGTQMNAGALFAEGDILIFLHADTEMPPDALIHIREIMKTGQYAAGAFRLGFDSQRPVYKFIETGASWRCRLTKIPYGDQAFFMPASYFKKIGGFAEIPIMEDIDLMRRIKQRGDRIFISPKYVRTSARRWEQEGIVYSVLRSWILAALFCLGVSPHRLARYYKIFRNENKI
ncbi:MAG: TIGR04283 family arsenosugar biosynthesis glycosyltransferase [Desulfobacterales bacterium]